MQRVHPCAHFIVASRIIIHVRTLSHLITPLSPSTLPLSPPLPLPIPLSQVVIQADPDLVALHCQEVGGKDFEICMPKVKDFIKYAVSIPYSTIHSLHTLTLHVLCPLASFYLASHLVYFCMICTCVLLRCSKHLLLYYTCVNLGSYYVCIPTVILGCSVAWDALKMFMYN